MTNAKASGKFLFAGTPLISGFGGWPPQVTEFLTHSKLKSETYSKIKVAQPMVSFNLCICAESLIDKLSAEPCLIDLNIFDVFHGAIQQIRAKDDHVGQLAGFQ